MSCHGYLSYRWCKDVKLRILIELLILYSLVYLTGFLNKWLIFYDFFATKVVLTFIREYGSTLYVGLARAVSPTNTNFRLTFLLTRLQEALYEDLAV